MYLKIKNVWGQNYQKAPGIDALSTNVIKHITQGNPDLLFNLYNKCLSIGVFPDIWKIVAVKVISKSSATTNNFSCNGS